MTPPAPIEPGPRSRLIRTALFVLVVLTLPALTAIVLSVRSTPLSVADEAAHLDVLRRVEDGGYPRIGDPLTTRTLADVACRGIGAEPTGCVDLAVVDPGAAGFSYKADEPPGYYAVTAAIRQVIRLTPADGFVQTARIATVTWLVAALAGLWAVLRRDGVATATTAAIVALVGASPLLVYRSATVTDEAALLAIGVAFVAATQRFRRRRATTDRATTDLAIAAALGAGACLIHPAAIFAAIASGLALVADGWATRGRADDNPADDDPADDNPAAPSHPSGIRLVAFALLPVVAGLASLGAWHAVSDARAVVAASVVSDAEYATQEPSSGVTLGEAVELTTHLLAGFDNSANLPVPSDVVYTAGPSRTGGWLLTAAPVVALAFGARTFADRIGAAALGVAILAAIGSVFVFHHRFAVEGGLSPAIGLVFVPAFALATARLAGRGWVPTAVIGGAATVMVVANTFAIGAL